MSYLNPSKTALETGDSVRFTLSDRWWKDKIFTNIPRTERTGTGDVDRVSGDAVLLWTDIAGEGGRLPIWFEWKYLDNLEKIE